MKIETIPSQKIVICCQQTCFSQKVRCPKGILHDVDKFFTSIEQLACEALMIWLASSWIGNGMPSSDANEVIGARVPLVRIIERTPWLRSVNACITHYQSLSNRLNSAVCISSNTSLDTMKIVNLLQCSKTCLPSSERIINFSRYFTIYAKLTQSRKAGVNRALNRCREAVWHNLPELISMWPQVHKLANYAVAHIHICHSPSHICHSA